MGIILLIIGFLTLMGTVIFWSMADDYDSILFVILAIICVAIFITVCVYGFKLGTEYQKSQKDEKYEICSLTTKSINTDSSKGIFVLGIGVYQKKEKENIYYYFYKKERQGGWKIEKVLADDVLIYEDADKKPYYVVTNKYYKDYDELHLPKNTIKKDINKIDINEVVKSN